MAEENDIVTSPEAATTGGVGVLGASTTREFIRYFAASALALAVDAGSLALMTSALDVPYLLSGGIAFMLGLVVIYVLSITWVFEKRDVRSIPYEFFVFALVGVVGLGMNELVLWLLTGYLGLFYLFSKAASVIVVFTWNFFARKHLLFR